MHGSWTKVPLLTLLSLSSFARPTPILDDPALVIREDSDLPPELEPVLQDDGLPRGNAADAIQDEDFTFTQEDLEKCPDYDPNQNQEGADDPAPKNKRGVREGSTKILRNLSSNGKLPRKGFMAYQEKQSIAIHAKGARGKKNKVITYETNEILPKKYGKPQNLQWQADHVSDLGIWTTIANRDTPQGVQGNAWSVVQDAVLGEEQDNDKDEKPNENTRTLARILNRPANMRGLSKEMNSAKGFLMSWAYGPNTDKPVFYKKVRRSNVWGVLRQLIRTQKQFDETTQKAASAIAGFIKNDETSAKAVEKLFNDEAQTFLKRAIDQLKKDLKNPPPEQSKDNTFQIEDCGNTSDDPDDPTESEPSTPTPSDPQPSTDAAPLPTPPPQPAAEDSCDVSYKFLFDAFEVRGKNFDKAKFGENGEGLKKQLDGCGKITDYKFEWTPNDAKYQWIARGRSIIGKKNCIGDAVVSAGGTTDGNCHGAG